MVGLNNSEKNGFSRRTALCAAMASRNGHSAARGQSLAHCYAVRPNSNNFFRNNPDRLCRDAFARGKRREKTGSPVNAFFSSDVECTDY
jgi:hypothetical protein